MTDKPDGGPAFSQTITPEADGGRMFPDEWGVGGMRLRDWFAGQALPNLVEEYHPALAADAAMQAYQYADAMIAARRK